MISQSEQIERWNIKKANWPAYQKAVNLPEILSSPNEACEEITQVILTAANQTIGKKQPCNLRPSAYWWNLECSKAKKAKVKALSRYKNHRGNLELWMIFVEARKKFSEIMYKAKQQSWEKFLENISSRTTATEVWKHVRMLRSKTVSRKIILKENDNYYTDPVIVANILGKHFAERSNGESSDPIFAEVKKEEEKKNINFEDTEDSYNCDIQIHELNYTLSSCISKSPGPDSPIPSYQTYLAVNY